MSMKLSDIAVLNIKSADYHCIILAELAKVRPKFYQFDQNELNIIKHKNLSPHLKMGKEILTIRNIKIKKN